jgi:hypothetical protein
VRRRNSRILWASRKTHVGRDALCVNSASLIAAIGLISIAPFRAHTVSSRQAGLLRSGQQSPEWEIATQDTTNSIDYPKVAYLITEEPVVFDKGQRGTR